MKVSPESVTDLGQGEAANLGSDTSEDTPAKQLVELVSAVECFAREQDAFDDEVGDVDDLMVLVRVGHIH